VSSRRSPSGTAGFATVPKILTTRFHLGPSRDQGSCHTGGVRNVLVALGLATAAGGVVWAFGIPPASPWPDPLAARLWQVGVHVLAFAIAPSVVARALGLDGAAIGLGLGESRRTARVCAAAIALAIPIVLLWSRQRSFAVGYPLLPAAAARPWLLALWLPSLALMLFSVELFFRGILLALLRPLGAAPAIAIMLVPYALVHRDTIEALGAIPVGALLGLLAWRSRSIWPGVLIHVTVAFLVELVALFRATIG
jgi:membrane protease YdiL (CAAX protease family)